MVSDCALKRGYEHYAFEVLILVVMEYGLRLSSAKSGRNESVWCLNPCCNGIWSQTSTAEMLKFQSVEESLNPCCNGIWSQTE